MQLSECPIESRRVAAATLHDQVSQAFVEWRDDVYRYLLTLGLHPGPAQEATQEVFLRLYVALRKQEESILNQRAWVFRVAHNLGLTLRTRENSLRPLDPELEAVLPDLASDPESSLLEREKLQRVHCAVQSLSPQQRQCLYLRAEGLRYWEIADTLGVTVSTVAEFLKRAVARLRKAVYE
jgi:RNA polymerase sigma-70 factor (ECF subfamily)